jgi:hypothetical protein
MYVRKPLRGIPNRSTSPARKVAGALNGTPAHGAPVTATTTSASARSASPPNVTSTAAAPSTLPTSRLASS